MTNLQREALKSARNLCQGAVSYVGAANYADREAKAQRDVDQAFQMLGRVFDKRYKPPFIPMNW